MKKKVLIFTLFLSVGVFAQSRVTAYHTNGNVKMEIKEVGARTLQKEYYRTGKVKQVGTYVNNEPYGVWRMYSPDGEIISTGFYDKGKKTGKWIINAIDSEAKYALYYCEGRRIDAIDFK